ncbi:MAG: HU family DNA-binding protein [Acidimicrobiia bacterium]
MNKSELAEAVGKSFGGNKSMGGAAVDAVLSAITDALASGNKVQISGFGTFEVRHRQARMGRNPRTGEPVHIKASNAPAFKAGKAFKEAVNPAPEAAFG